MNPKMRKPLATKELPRYQETRQLPKLVLIGSTLHHNDLERLQEHLGGYGFSDEAVVTIQVTREEKPTNPFPKESK